MTKVQWNGDAYLRRLRDAVDEGLYAAAQVMANQAVINLSGPSPSKPGDFPGVDTGHLRNSIAAVHPRDLGTPGRAAFGTAVMYGRYLELGAFITPKKSKYLAIPVDRAMAQRLRRLGGGVSVRSIPGLKYIPPGKNRKPGYGGRLVIANSVKVSVRGASRKSRTVAAGTTAFVLKDSVVLKPRPWLRRSAIMAKAAAATAFASTVKKKMGVK